VVFHEDGSEDARPIRLPLNVLGRPTTLAVGPPHPQCCHRVPPAGAALRFAASAPGRDHCGGRRACLFVCSFVFSYCVGRQVSPNFRRPLVAVVNHRAEACAPNPNPATCASSGFDSPPSPVSSLSLSPLCSRCSAPLSAASRTACALSGLSGHSVRCISSTLARLPFTAELSRATVP
jgi:hypothetical protein